MPSFGPTGYINGLTAGTQVSSTYEGRHLKVLESDMVHESGGDGFVDKGDPFVAGTAVPGNCIVGVAFTSAAADTDEIAVDTEGIWNLSVVSSNDGGASDIVFGDQIFINVSTAVLSKIRNLPTQRPFGYSVNTTTITGAGTASVIPVKIHWDPWWWDHFHTVTVNGGDNAWSMTAVDSATGTGGITNGLFVQLTNTGDKTGTGTINALGSDLFVNADVPYAYGHAGYTGAVADHTVGFLCGVQWYMENCGDSCANWVVADLGMNSADAPSGRHAYIRCREHGAIQALETVLLCEGGAAATYLLTIDTVTNMLSASGAAGNLTHKLACLIQAGGLTRFLYLYDS